jgi:SAM-dependent methyltransferase
MEADGLQYNSGSGSDRKFSIPYSKMLRDYMIKNSVSTVVDLGCGDFRVGSLLIDEIDEIEKYIGIDVVPALINHLNRRYRHSDNIEFLCRDIVNDDFLCKGGGVYLIRQVLQHLSNKEIRMVMEKMPSNARVIVTEHQPVLTEKVKPNIDKIRGADTRIKTGSAVFLEKEPFYYETRLLQEIKINENECIRSFDVSI